MFIVRKFRIHGDNIVECHRTLSIIAEAYGQQPHLVDSPIFAPVYAFFVSNKICYYELLAGYGRWGCNLGEILMQHGALLHEGADSYVTELNDENEQILFAIEYCSALPAGNNAWQRNGRAFASVLAGIPYLYYAEIGGMELDKDRNIKAARVPNPVVPFSYLSMSVMSGVLCMPVYRPHPSISEGLYSHFNNVFGYEVSLRLIVKLMEGEPYTEEYGILASMTLDLVKILADARRSVDTFRGLEWDYFLRPDIKTAVAEESTLNWKKKIADKVTVTSTFQQLFEAANKFPCKTLGAKSIPLCFIPQSRVMMFGEILSRIYPTLPIELNYDRPLVIVWLTGFKPGGEDSRPDRGLAPLSRMLIGYEADVMAVIYGPVKNSIYTQLTLSLSDVAVQNGLFASVASLCNHLIVDIASHPDSPLYYHIIPVGINIGERVAFGAFETTCAEFSEHDTDTSIRQIFRHNNFGIQECLCNPPGGDWSGISYFTADGEYRWTSLPRVSEIRGKRPDHVFQFSLDERLCFVAIESKGCGKDLEKNIGPSLKAYLEDVFENAPTCSSVNGSDWRCHTGSFSIQDYDVVTVGAFKYESERELFSSLLHGSLDAVIAFEFGNITKVHVAYMDEAAAIIPELLRHTTIDGSRLEIEVHAFSN